jgi:adenine-specific DNA-methyltransferase
MKPTILAHSLEIYVPSHCRCGKTLPDDLREEILGEVKATMAGWFGGGSSKKIDPRVERIQGIWDSGCGKPDEEFIDVVQSHTDEETRDEYFTEFTAYVAQLANRLTQQAMACRVDGKMFIYPATADPKPHRCAGGATTTTTPKPQESGALDRKMALQAALQRMGSANDVRDIFCNLLHYEYQDATLPTAKWPETVKQCLAPGAAPQVIADQNGFKIIYLQLADGNLRKSSERQLVQRLVKEDPGMRGLVVVSDINQKHWNLVNVKFDRDGKNRDQILLRRMRVGPGQPVRTAVERLSQVDVEIIGEEAGAADLQDKHDSAFDVEAVTKQFFSDVANWYFWALKHAQFPKDAPKEDDGHDHVSLIRLITRLIFCWFLREKGLIPDPLFDRRKLTEILDGFAPDKVKDKNSVFYRAILQNLFFATLSTETDKRKWATDEQNFMAHSLYRFKDCFQKPANALNLFKSIPFLNGGLFECLDRDLGEGNKPRYIRIDGFSRREDSQPTVPDFLFFGSEREIDLSEEYGDKKFRSVRVRGLIETLRHYNFTIEENTPIEEEVALDPELCGKVFENLLAAYNPETGTTARKQSGSFYTPREIVNYMVDEALIASLATKLEATVPAAKEIEPRLRHLFAYNDEPNPFNPQETTALIAAIDTLKTLDPAVGSGAFPMGLLHKLVFILGKLDPRNEQWKQRQIARVNEAIAVAEKIEDDTIRSRTVEELEQQVVNVNESFDRNEMDYGRKLYLIENCIYGVDIQPIAVQIAKMRFFISLIVDQKIDDSLPNRGVRPLPNLETKFVAANSLIGINRQGQLMLRNEKIAAQIHAKETELRRVRERHFMARTPKQKSKCRDEDARLRVETSELLKGDGWDTATATRLASWNPYDQNTSAPFYDAEWMFGLLNGFDVVIANPPYIFARNSAAKGMTQQAKDYYYATYTLAEYQVNLYPLFIEAGDRALNKLGVLCFITPNNWLTLNTNQKLRRFVLGRSKVSILNFYKRVFESADVDAAIVSFQKPVSASNSEKIQLREWTSGPELIAETPKSSILSIKDCIINIGSLKSEETTDLVAKIEYGSRALNAIATVKSGLKAYEIGKGSPPQTAEMKSNRVYHTTRPAAGFNMYLDGRDVCRYFIGWSGEYIKYGRNLAAPRGSFALFSTPRILVRQIPSKPPYCINACFTDEILINDLNSMNIVHLTVRPQLILAVLNSRLMSYWFVHKFGKMQRGIFPQFKVNELATFPMPRSFSPHETDLVRLIDEIINTKKQDSQSDISRLNRKVDSLVYDLYGLSETEIGVIEES